MRKIITVLMVITLVLVGVAIAQSGITVKYGIPYEVDVQPSWQLVGNYNHNRIHPSSALTTADINAVYALDSSQQTYIRMHPNPETAKIAAAGLTIGTGGMWVHSSKAGSLQYTSIGAGAVSGTSFPSGYIFYSLNDLTDIGESLNAHKGTCQFTHVWEYDAARQLWESVPSMLDHVPVDPDDRGRVLVLWLPQSCNLN
jgi:hypothetical protein